MTDHADDAAVGEPDAPERVLVVEDLASQAELARLFLAGLGYEVRVASTGAAALDIAREWEPDGLLLDIELPDFNGLDLLARLHEAGSDAVIVVVTAGGSMEMAKNAIRAGAEDYVVKPYNKDRQRTAAPAPGAQPPRAGDAAQRDAQSPAGRRDASGGNPAGHPGVCQFRWFIATDACGV
jgi:CheY-like chemotaxis protein